MRSQFIPILMFGRKCQILGHCVCIWYKSLKPWLKKEKNKPILKKNKNSNFLVKLDYKLDYHILFNTNVLWTPKIEKLYRMLRFTISWSPWKIAWSSILSSSNQVANFIQLSKEGEMLDGGHSSVPHHPFIIK
jgi:hypothetical protein